MDADHAAVAVTYDTASVSLELPVKVALFLLLKYGHHDHAGGSTAPQGALETLLVKLERLLITMSGNLDSSIAAQTAALSTLTANVAAQNDAIAANGALIADLRAQVAAGGSVSDAQLAQLAANTAAASTAGDDVARNTASLSSALHP